MHYHTEGVPVIAIHESHSWELAVATSGMYAMQFGFISFCISVLLWKREPETELVKNALKNLAAYFLQCIIIIINVFTIYCADLVPGKHQNPDLKAYRSIVAANPKKKWFKLTIFFIVAILIMIGKEAGRKCQIQMICMRFAQSYQRGKQWNLMLKMHFL